MIFYESMNTLYESSGPLYGSSIRESSDPYNGSSIREKSIYMWAKFNLHQQQKEQKKRINEIVDILLTNTYWQLCYRKDILYLIDRTANLHNNYFEEQDTWICPFKIDYTDDIQSNNMNCCLLFDYSHDLLNNIDMIKNELLNRLKTKWHYYSLIKEFQYSIHEF